MKIVAIETGEDGKHSYPPLTQTPSSKTFIRLIWRLAKYNKSKLNSKKGNKYFISNLTQTLHTFVIKFSRRWISAFTLFSDKTH